MQTLFEAALAGVPTPTEPVHFAEVALFMPLGRSYSFSIPEALAESAVTGARVVCGLRGRRILGVVLDVKRGDPGVDPRKLKPILAVVDAEPVVPSELLGFVCELSNYYLAPIGEVLRLAVPAVERTRARALKQDGLSPERRLAAVGRALAHVTARIPEPDARAALEGKLGYPPRVALNFPGIGKGELEPGAVYPLLTALPETVTVYAFGKERPHLEAAGIFLKNSG